MSSRFPRPRKRRASRIPRLALPRPQSVPLVGQAWAPGDAEARPRPTQRLARAAAVVAALVELVLLLWLLAGPSFQVRSVEVTGNQRLTSAQVVSAAGMARPGSVFAVDAATIRRKLTATPWVRDATVTTTLPDRVVLSVDEWQPVAVYLAGGKGQPFFLSDQAAVLGPAANAGGVLEVDGPAGADPKVGAHPVDQRLLTAMVNIQKGLPSLISQQVKSFQVDSCGDLTMTVQRGWRALFGRVITPEEFAALNQKLAALKSIAAKEDLNNPNLDYVNLESAQLPTAGFKNMPAPSPSPSVAPSPAPPVPRPIPVPCR